MSRERSKTHPAARQPRPSRRIHEEAAGKLPDETRCPECGASLRKGRWTWASASPGGPEHVCPACERIATDHPAGLLRVEGGFAQAHRDEILALIRNLEERERAAHPLKRIMDISEEGPGLSVTVTDAKLALSFGSALESAYEGRLERPTTTSETENLVRVCWTRD